MSLTATQHPPGDLPPGSEPGALPVEPDKGPNLPTVPPTPEGEPVPKPQV